MGFFKSKLSLKYLWKQKWVHHEKVGSFGKDKGVGENRRQQKDRKTKYETD